MTSPRILHRRTARLLAAVLSLALLAFAAVPATAAVPSNGVYENHNSQAYDTHVRSGCQYVGKFNVTSDGLKREMSFLGFYQYEPPTGCHVSILLRFWDKDYGVDDINIVLKPGQNGKVYVGHALARRLSDPGWKFVLMTIDMYPATRGVQQLSSVSVAYDVNPCLKYPAVCAPFADWREKSGYYKRAA